MRVFNKKNKIVDERIVNMANKIYKDAYFITIIISIVSIIVKYAMYGMNPQLIYTELLIIFVSSSYYMFRTIQLGIYNDEIEVHDRTTKISMSVKNVLIGIGVGIVLALFFGIRSALLYGDDSNRLWYFILVFFASFIIYIPFFVSVIAIFDMIARKASKQTPPNDKEV